MKRGALVLLTVALLAWCGCENKQQELGQSTRGQIEPVLQVTRVNDDTFAVTCELRSREPGKDPVSLRQRLLLHGEQPGQITLSSNRYLRFLLEVAVLPTDNPMKVRVTYLLLLATPQGIRPWQGREVDWTVGEARVLPDDLGPTATAPAAAK